MHTVVGLVAYGRIGPSPSGGTRCEVSECAVLDDGTELVLLDDRGWGSSQPFADMTLTHAVQGVYTASLPDDAERTGEFHEWEQFVDALSAAGITSTVDELRHLPYRVVLVFPESAGGPNEDENYYDIRGASRHEVPESTPEAGGAAHPYVCEDAGPVPRPAVYRGPEL